MTSSSKSTLDAQNVLSIRRDLTDKISHSRERLSSGLRVNGSGADAGILAIASEFKEAAAVLGTGAENATDILHAYAHSGNATNALSVILSEIGTLAYLASNLVTPSTQREKFDEEAQALVDQYNQIVSSAAYNSFLLLDGSNSELRVQTGSTSYTISTVNLEQELSVNLTTQQSAAESYSVASQAISNVNVGVAQITGNVWRLESAINLLSESRSVNEETAERIVSADIASEKADLVKNLIRLDRNTAILAQANLDSTRVLSLLEGSGIGISPKKANLRS